MSRKIYISTDFQGRKLRASSNKFTAELPLYKFNSEGGILWMISGKQISKLKSLRWTSAKFN